MSDTEAELDEDEAAPPSSKASTAHPFTLAIDIGGTGLKASVLDADGAMVADRVKIPTTYPLPPTELVSKLTTLVKPLPAYDRISAGFPGMVRAGVVLSAPTFSKEKGPGSPTDPDLVKAWYRFDLAKALESALGKPARAANDADVQGAAVAQGKGLELVVTLGTGFGTAVFMEGRLLPHLEIAHQPFRKGDTYDDQLGERARKEIGEERWNRRVRKAIDQLYQLFYFDHLFIGGGNARRIKRDDLGDMLDRVTIVDNTAGILGGVKLWGEHHLGV